MAKHFVTAQGGIITGQHAGDIDANFSGTPYHGHERIVIPRGLLLADGDRVEFYDSNWIRKSDIRLIDEGLMSIPEGYVREGDQLRLMTEVELIKAGLTELPEGHILDGDDLRPMTEVEQFEAGLITKAEYQQRIAADNSAELNRRLSELQTPIALAQAEIDEKYAVERKAKLTSLLAVTKQKGWPLEVKWPE